MRASRADRRRRVMIALANAARLPDASAAAAGTTYRPRRLLAASSNKPETISANA